MRTTSLLLVGLLATTASAVITIEPEPRSELLYSTSKDVDCTALHALPSAELPQNVVRLRALVDGAPVDPAAVTLQWSLRGKAVGTLAADLDLGPTGELPSVTAMCADFGNECTLAAERLRTYDRDTIFWVAPTCEGVKRDPSRPFGGGTVKVRVKASQNGRKLGKADAVIGYGRNGAATLYVENTAGDLVDGVGRDAAVTTYVITTYAARIAQPDGVAKPPETYDVSGDLGSVRLETPCGGGFDACAALEQSGGGGTMLLTAAFEDDSALCDNISVVIAQCRPSGNIQIVPTPKRTRYDPADPSQQLVDVEVRLNNTSQPGDGLPACPFYLRGNIASCTSTLKVAGFTETKTTSFSLPRCSTSADVACGADADCRPPVCENCAPDERCLLGPYCSTTTSRDCTQDADCAAPACPECQPQEICVRMLDFPDSAVEILIPPGKSATLVSGTVALRNRFAKTAVLTDTWTVSVRIPSLTFEKNLKYKIRGRPQ